jgi:GDP-L-fucose synthase
VTAEDFHADTRQFFAGRSVAITGGTGFIGSHAVEQLLTLGARPVVLTRRTDAPFLSHLRGEVELRPCDLNDFAATRVALRDVSCVLSLAAQVAGLEYNARHAASIFQANLSSFFNTIRAANELKIDRFLVTSSACVYPRHCSIPTPEEEGTTDEPEPTNSGYGWSKRMEEYLGAQYAKEFGMSVAIARPYNAYGPRDNFDAASSHVIPALILKAFRSTDGTLPVWGDGSHSRSFLYVDDFARGLLEVAARHAHADPVNIGAGEETTIRETATLIARLVSDARRCALVPVFDPAGLTGQPRRRCDTRKIERLLGYRTKVPFQEGLARTIHWFRDHEDIALPPHP